jgi:hypothetical protein
MCRVLRYLVSMFTLSIAPLYVEREWDCNGISDCKSCAEVPWGWCSWHQDRDPLIPGRCVYSWELMLSDVRVDSSEYCVCAEAFDCDSCAKHNQTCGFCPYKQGAGGVCLGDTENNQLACPEAYDGWNDPSCSTTD